MKKGHFIILFALLLSSVLGFSYYNIKSNTINQYKNKTYSYNKDLMEVCIDTFHHKFLGIVADSMIVDGYDFSKKDKLQNIFKQNNISTKQYQSFVKKTKDYYDFSTVKPNQEYFVFKKETDSNFTANYIAFKLNATEYLIADVRDTLKISFYNKPIDTLQKNIRFAINRSLSKTLKTLNLDASLTEKLERAFKDQFSINRLNNNDTLSFIYNEYYVNSDFYDYGDIIAAEIKTKKKQYFTVQYFIAEDSTNYYLDEKGKYNRMAFLKSPLEKGRLASRYNLTRMHPVLQEIRPHLGTDFAAPTGTPILATASGKILEARFKENNGNYIKIKHNRTYTTQYLHMSRFAKGIRAGKFVKQGEVIGYVGSTGLSTGPHVCYRFWKNGEQVDPFKEKLNVQSVIPKKEEKHFNEYVLHLKEHFEHIPLLIEEKAI
ncbi:MAG: M23 family metallopeptidase [Chitinophagales bacterium]|nr:M23 family metallopeptidase [Chitinophagales bacterium]